MAGKKSEISSMGTVGAFINGRACSDTLFCVLERAFGRASGGGERPAEERAAMPFAGGIMQHGYQYGMIWGATLAAGAQAHRLFGGGPRAEAAALAAAARVVESFRALTGHVNCFEITELEELLAD
jgi:hypothetical protein